MPDIATLIDIADFYGIVLREIIDGERKNETMNSETRETVRKVAEYADAEKERIKRK